MVHLLNRHSLNHIEQDAGKDEAKDHDKREANARSTDDICVLLQRHCRHIVAPVVVRVVQRLPANAGLPLAPVDLLAARIRHAPLPVPIVVHAAAVKPRLDTIPGIRDDLTAAVQPNGGAHLLPHCVFDLLPEYVAQNAAN